MPRKSNTRSAQGGGSIRQRADGRWEARFTYTDELGQKKRASVYADTQKECRQKLTAALKSVDEGSYIKTQRIYFPRRDEKRERAYCRRCPQHHPCLESPKGAADGVEACGWTSMA